MRFNTHNVLKQIIVSFAFTFVLFFLFPLQTFCTNKMMFDYAVGDIIVDLLMLTCSSWFFLVMLQLLAQIFPKCFQNAIQWLLVFGIAYVYFETSIFSIGLPALDGGRVVFTNPYRQLLDCCLIFTLFVLFVVLRKYIVRFAVQMSFVFCIMFTASIFDAQMREDNDKHSVDGAFFQRHSDVVNSLKFSKRSNVIVFSLDAVPATIAQRVIEKHLDISKSFPGFVAFDNNIGMHYPTHRGFPALMTGEYMESYSSAANYAKKIYGDQSFLMSYFNNGYACYFSPPENFRAFTNRDVLTDRDALQNDEVSVFYRNSKGVPFINLKEVLIFRLLPYRWKCCVIRSVERRIVKIRRDDNKSAEDFVYNKILNAKLSELDDPVFAMFHTTGGHVPLNVNEDGKPVPAEESVTALERVMVYKLRFLGRVMSKLRELGIYDDAMIIITTDHGNILMRSGEKDHGAQSALLWVKPRGSIGKFIHDNQPTSHCRIAELMRQAAVKKLSLEEIKKILFVENRAFVADLPRRIFGVECGKVYYRWTYDKTGRMIGCEKE